jgi:hypothetical protein
MVLVDEVVDNPRELALGIERVVGDSEPAGDPGGVARVLDRAAAAVRPARLGRTARAQPQEDAGHFVPRFSQKVSGDARVDAA